MPTARRGQPPFLLDRSRYSSFPIQVVLAPYFGIIGFPFLSVTSLNTSLSSLDLVTMMPTSISPQSK